MRESKVGNITFTVNGLTRKVFKKGNLKKYGYGFLGQESIPEGMDQEECFIKFIEASIDKEEIKHLDDITPKQMLKLYKDCIAETYGSKEEEKNL